MISVLSDVTHVEFVVMSTTFVHGISHSTYFASAELSFSVRHSTGYGG